MPELISKNFERSKYRGPIKAVILDWAGTVVDFGSCAPVAAFIEAFRSFDVQITQAQARGPMGKAKRDHIAAILELPEVAESWRATNDSDTDAAIDLIYERFLPIQKTVLNDHSELIPGALDAINACRERGMKIGSSTGYTRELMEIVMPTAAEQGYQPDAMLCATDITPGRPAPWMCLENARLLGVFPPQACVKVDDTTVGVEAGINAGMWTIGVAASGNLVGLDYQQYTALPEDERGRLLANAREQLVMAGAHVVVETTAELADAIGLIESAMADSLSV